MTSRHEPIVRERDVAAGPPDCRFVSEIVDLTGLASFNIGVEIGQLTVITAAMLLVSGVRKKAWYRSRVVIPASLFIAAVGLFWTFQRALG